MPVPEILAADILTYPTSFHLKQNFPNPFNPTTKIPFDIPELEEDITIIKINIFNHLGQKVKTLYNGPLSAGTYELEWSGLDDSDRKMPSGVYIYHLYSTEYTASRKMILVK